MIKKKHQETPTAYRVVPNRNSNDFNDEPKYRIVKYNIDIKNNRMKVRGFGKWHKIMDDTIYSEIDAQKILQEKLSGEVK